MMLPSAEIAAFPCGRPGRGRVALTLLIAAATALSAGPLPAAAAEPPAAQPVDLLVDSAALRFEPRLEAPAWALTVSGPEGYYLRREFRDGAPRLDLVAPAGGPLADGVYRWELRTTLAAGAAEWSPAYAWGHFIVRRGVALLPEPAVERPRGSAGEPSDDGPAPLAPTHGTDVDVYIDGHLCVGGGAMASHCTGAESLAQRTILMKEDNVRLRFEDTSDPASSFASTDWQLLANDYNISGDDYFAVQDLGDDGTTPTTPLRIDADAGDNAIRVDGSGKVGLGTTTPGARLHVAGDAIVEGDFTAGSSRDIKHAFAPVVPRAVLARLVELPVAEWSYRDGRAGIRHLGPVAEEFHAAFGLGRDERHVSPLDLSGVAFAAIQGLHQLVREREAEIEELRASRDDLLARIEALERRAAEAAPGAGGAVEEAGRLPR
jgi:hypothetical protein